MKVSKQDYVRDDVEVIFSREQISAMSLWRNVDKLVFYKAIRFWH